MCFRNLVDTPLYYKVAKNDGRFRKLQKKNN